MGGSPTPVASQGACPTLAPSEGSMSLFEVSDPGPGWGPLVPSCLGYFCSRTMGNPLKLGDAFEL